MTGIQSGGQSCGAEHLTCANLTLTPGESGQDGIEFVGHPAGVKKTGECEGKTTHVTSKCVSSRMYRQTRFLLPASPLRGDGKPRGCGSGRHLPFPGEDQTLVQNFPLGNAPSLQRLLLPFPCQSRQGISRQLAVKTWRGFWR